MPPHTLVELKAKPAAGWRLDTWTGTCMYARGLPTCTRTADSNLELGVVFEKALSNVRVDVLGNGRVTSSPPGIDCTDRAGKCLALFSYGATVELVAAPSAGWELVTWGDSCRGSSRKCIVPLNVPGKAVTAAFLPTR